MYQKRVCAWRHAGAEFECALCTMEKFQVRRPIEMNASFVVGLGLERELLQNRLLGHCNHPFDAWFGEQTRFGEVGLSAPQCVWVGRNDMRRVRTVRRLSCIRQACREIQLTSPHATVATCVLWKGFRAFLARFAFGGGVDSPKRRSQSQCSHRCLPGISNV